MSDSDADAGCDGTAGEISGAAAAATMSPVLVTSCHAVSAISDGQTDQKEIEKPGKEAVGGW